MHNWLDGTYSVFRRHHIGGARQLGLHTMSGRLVPAQDGADSVYRMRKRWILPGWGECGVAMSRGHFL